MYYEKNALFVKIKNLNLTIPLILTIICLYGFLVLYSASGGSFHPWAYKQMLAFIFCIPLIFFILIIDLRIIYQFSYIFYLFTLILLIIVEFSGKSAMGATRWLDLKIVTIQPSELVKLSTILMLARYYNDVSEENINNHHILIPIFASIIPIFLVIKQPDLGTGMITLSIVIIMIFAAGVKISYFIISGISALLAMPIMWLLLHQYQKKRILTFLYPENDPLGAGYNIIQSKISIGSGGLFGKGFLSGTQSHLSFLPEHQTDFIFSFLSEEFGFVGGMFLLILYLILIISSLLISANSRSKFTKLMVVGISGLFFSHVFVNMAMVMGLLPVVGVPLPLISYGRTMMVSMMIGFALILNASVNKHKNI